MADNERNNWKIEKYHQQSPRQLSINGADQLTVQFYDSFDTVVHKILL